MFVVSNLQGGNSIVEIFSAFCWKYVSAFAILGLFNRKKNTKLLSKICLEKLLLQIFVLCFSVLAVKPLKVSSNFSQNILIFDISVSSRGQFIL